MKVIGIVCSPRKKGNTEILISRALDGAREAGAEETEMICLAGKNINPCDGCESCTKKGKCRIDDDMQEIYPRLLEADGIIFGSPVYFWGVTAQAKMVMDRCHCWMQAHRHLVRDRIDTSKLVKDKTIPWQPLRNKAGGIVAVATKVGATQVIQQLSNFFRVLRIIEAGSAIAYADKKGEVRKDEQGLREAWMVGRAVVRTIKLVKATES
ncbi:MAG: flavodoxin family protein [Georgfuchsia sp.]